MASGASGDHSAETDVAVERLGWRARLCREGWHCEGSGGAATGEAWRRRCALVQRTSDKSRTDAHRFYERLGFVASHEGLKLGL